MNERDRGAALVIAIAFVVMIGAIGAGLAGMITSSAHNRVTLQLLRNREYAADGAIQEAIAEVRALPRTTSASCSTTAGTSSSTVNGMAMHVDWQAACTVVRTDDGTVVSQRNIVFAACEATGPSCNPDQVVIRAQVNFRDDPSGQVVGTAVQSWSVNG
jgi:hypothetical protein